jgi:DNA-binding NarL/FixJ family response regulator
VLGALQDYQQDFGELPRPALPLLSARQRSVLDRVLEGKPNRQIAGELAISLKTVEFHRARIMQKLGVRTAAELFRRCLGSN